MYVMVFGKALYYPTIDIKDEEWLKNAYLFWDGIYTISPVSLADRAFQNNTTHYLKDMGYLQTININPNSVAVRNMASVVRRLSKTAEGQAYLKCKLPEDVYSNPYDDARSEFYLHHEKLPLEIQQMIGDRIGEDGWARVSENFADFYMTILADKIASEKSLALLTSNQRHESLAAFKTVDSYSGRYSMAGHRVESLGRCMMTRMIIDGIKIDPLTSIADLQVFKRHHQTELWNFRNGLEEIVKMDVPPDITMEGLEQRVRDVYENKFRRAYQDLQDSLHGFGIHYLIGGGVATLAFSDVSTWFNDLLSGLPGPYQFALGAGAMLAYKGYKTVKENKEIKRKHPMSYLLSIERELSARG